jgi:hypothetical protein
VVLMLDIMKELSDSEFEEIKKLHKYNVRKKQLQVLLAEIS